MKQVNNGYADYYYLLEDGRIYNAATEAYIEPNSRHQYRLKTIDSTYKYIALKSLYKLVYNKVYSKDSIEDLEGEQWKEVDHTDGIYLISNKGRIKSLQGYEAAILNPYVTQNGYRRVDVIQDGKRVSKLMHRLVAAAFIPMPKSIDHQLHHIDFNKNNNAATILEWLSCQDHAKKHIDRSKNNAEE